MTKQNSFLFLGFHVEKREKFDAAGSEAGTSFENIFRLWRGLVRGDWWLNNLKFRALQTSL